MNCQYCNRECKNTNSLRNHERLCKSNPNRQLSDMSAAIAMSARLSRTESKKRKDKLIIEYLKNPKICQECGNEHDFDKRNNKFCSASCGAANANRRKPKRTVESRNKTSKSVSESRTKKATKKENRNCLSCGVSMPHNRKYCSDIRCRFEQRSLAAKQGYVTTVARGKFIGWKKRTKKSSYPEQYFIDLFNNESIVEYVRELPQCGFFIDFAFVDKMIALEIDGKQHELPERKEKDKIKDELLVKNGWTVFRIKWFNPRTQKGKEQLYPQIEKFKKLISS